MNINSYRNIIFDLGGVIIDITLQKTIDEFQKYTNLNVKDYYHGHNPKQYFKEYEVGTLTSEEFRQQLRNELFLQATDTQIDSAWCALIGEFPSNKIALLKDIKEHKRIFLYSNTCEIHYTFFRKRFKEIHQGQELDELFEKAYYSHLLGYRKPGTEGFRKILEDNNLVAKETLFIDDSLENIKGAQTLGLGTFHVSDDKSILDLIL